jgi:deoxycytidylate deaminase
VRSLKHPAEVVELRRIYPRGFYLFGIHTADTRRLYWLQREHGGMSEDAARELINRDRAAPEAHGQHTADTFQSADFFLVDDGDKEVLENHIERCLELVFGRPHATPTFAEFAMFMAFAASLRSGDLARQVGAVIVKGEEILGVGANDCPKFGGGLYWPRMIGKRIQDEKGGRDSTLERDTNALQRERMMNSICQELGLPPTPENLAKLARSKLKEVMEFTRSVHAELEAILSCARKGTSCAGATLYCTTYPCHNCARHIIAAGIRDVVYVEPYAKSKAIDLHPDALTGDESESSGKVLLRPFVGVGARQFFNFFSMSQSAGTAIERKTTSGVKTPWDRRSAAPRVPMVAVDYMTHERAAAERLKSISPGTSS